MDNKESMTDQEIILALREFPRAIFLSMNGTKKISWEEFCKAQDRYENALAILYNRFK
jgi:hypothetical protein